MTQEREKQVLQWTAVGTLVAAAVFFVLTFVAYYRDALWEPFFVLFLGLACQCGIRLILTTRLAYNHDRTFITNSGWFQKNALDKWLLRHPSNVWKMDLQYYDPEAFSLAANAPDAAVQHTCTYELMNEFNALFAFLGVVLAVMTDNKPAALAILLILAVSFSLYSLIMAVRARMFRFDLKAGRV